MAITGKVILERMRPGKGVAWSMAERILGGLYYERMGRSGPGIVFAHPNPMDQSAWTYQMTHLSTWYRCIAIDMPGYGRSPKATEGLTLRDLAQAYWEAVDEALGDLPVVLVGCSAGALITPQMYHLRPSRTLALVISSSGALRPLDEWSALLASRVAGYEKEGIAYRWRYTFDVFSPAFKPTALARYFAELFAQRNHIADAESIVHQLRALGSPRPDTFYSGIACPTLIITGTEDRAHPWDLLLKERIPGCELRIIPGAGHACQLEQPLAYDGHLIEFLQRRRIHPDADTA